MIFSLEILPNLNISVKFLCTLVYLEMWRKRKNWKVNSSEDSIVGVDYQSLFLESNDRLSGKLTFAKFSSNFLIVPRKYEKLLCSKFLILRDIA